VPLIIPQPACMSYSLLPLTTDQPGLILCKKKYSSATTATTMPLSPKAYTFLCGCFAA
jgi:hypothetical protein